MTAICDYNFNKGDVARFIYIDEKQNDNTIFVEVLETVHDFSEKWYIVSAQKNACKHSGLNENEEYTAKYDLPNKQVSLVHPDELEPNYRKLELIKQ